MSARATDNGNATQPQNAAQLNWPEITTFPSGDPAVLLMFHGLMSLAYNPDGGFCEVGIHAQSPHHEFKIVVKDSLANGNLLQTYEFGPGQNWPTDTIEFDVVSPSTEGVGFFMPPGFVRDPQSGRMVSDNRDFRLIPDFESPDFYDVHLEKVPGAFRPRIRFSNGVFFTLMPTVSRFKRVAENESLPLGPIARIIGAYVYLNDDGFIELRIGTEPPLRLLAAGGKKYSILFDNSCQNCSYNPTSAAKEERNDFFLYYNTLEIPANRQEYELILDGSAPPIVVPQSLTPARASGAKIASSFRPLVDGVVSPQSNDNTPCGPTGFGQSGGVTSES